MRTLPACLLALAACLPLSGQAAEALSPLEGFYPLAHGASQGTRDLSGWSVACTASRKGELGILSLLADKGGRIVLAAYTQAPPESVSALFNLRNKGATRDWALIFDRAGQGRVDYLAFFMGSQPVKPAAFRADFPKGQGLVRKEDVDYLFDHMAMVFYHAADDNGDGLVDGVVYPLADAERPAWIDGFAVLKSDGKGETVVRDWRFRGDINVPLGPVPRNAQGFQIRLNPKEGAAPDAILPLWNRILGDINTTLKECRMGDRLIRRP